MVREEFSVIPIGPVRAACGCRRPKGPQCTRCCTDQVSGFSSFRAARVTTTGPRLFWGLLSASPRFGSRGPEGPSARA